MTIPSIVAWLQAAGMTLSVQVVDGGWLAIPGVTIAVQRVSSCDGPVPSDPARVEHTNGSEGWADFPANRTESIELLSVAWADSVGWTSVFRSPSAILRRRKPTCRFSWLFEFREAIPRTNIVAPSTRLPGGIKIPRGTQSISRSTARRCRSMRFSLRRRRHQNSSRGSQGRRRVAVFVCGGATLRDLIQLVWRHDEVHPGDPCLPCVTPSLIATLIGSRSFDFV